MAYLIDNDYDRLIQDVSLSQIISGKPMLKIRGEAAAIEEVKSYLRAKYEVAKEFTDTTVYGNTVTYKATNRVYINSSPYSAASTYNVGDMVLQEKKIYRNITQITIGEAFNIAKWELVGD